MRTLAIVIFLLSITSPAFAMDSICDGLVVNGTKKTERYPFPLRKGEVVSAITQYNISKKDGTASYCSHGGGCFPAEAIKLTNCKVNFSKPDWQDDQQKSYSLSLIRSRVEPDRLRENDIELQLLKFGMCHACASNATAFYLNRPSSTCARIIKRALEGSPDAREKLEENPEFCLHYY